MAEKRSQKLWESEYKSSVEQLHRIWFVMHSENRKDCAQQQRTVSTGVQALTTKGLDIVIPVVMVGAPDTHNPLEITPVGDEFFYPFCEAK